MRVKYILYTALQAQHTQLQQECLRTPRPIKSAALAGSADGVSVATGRQHFNLLLEVSCHQINTTSPRCKIVRDAADSITHLSSHTQALSMLHFSLTMRIFRSLSGLATSPTCVLMRVCDSKLSLTVSNPPTSHRFTTTCPCLPPARSHQALHMSTQSLSTQWLRSTPFLCRIMHSHDDFPQLYPHIYQAKDQTYQPQHSSISISLQMV